MLAPREAAASDYLERDGTAWFIRPDGSGNPYTQTIGQGRNTPLHQPDILTVDIGAAISVTNSNAISLGDNATIYVNGTVTGNSSYGGLYGTGPNVIEGNSNLTIYVGLDAQGNINRNALVEQTGNTTNGEAINLHGFGNEIINYGVIRNTQNAAAIWFQDVVSSGGDPSLRNIVQNYGQIIQSNGRSVIGTSAGNGIIFYNYTGAAVTGNLTFSGGNDDLYFYAGSTVNGSIDGGGGNNRLFLAAAGGSDDTLASPCVIFRASPKPAMANGPFPAPFPARRPRCARCA